MNNDPSEVSGPPATNQNGIEHTEVDTRGDSPAQKGQSPAAQTTEDQSKVNNHVGNGVEDGRSDSEAETVVMPGKEEASSNGPKRAIKHEGSSRPKTQPKAPRDEGRELPKEGASVGSEKPKKSNPLTETNNSSNLSSARSSPGVDQAARPASRANSESGRSKSNLSHASDNHARGSVSKKRKISGDETEEKSQRRRAKRERRSEEPSLAEPRRTSNLRSESPSRQRPRALSIQSSNPGSTQKRKKPPPLLVGSKRRPSDASHSNESSSERVSSAHPRRSATLDDPAMPRTHRKLRDKNGRTILARACASEDVDTVVARLEERPEDLDEEDNAGNTPLQIASLEGSVDIVKVLLQHGCKIDCMNTDRDTPLIDAVENSHLDVVKLLLKAGVNPRQVNAKGEEPIDLVDMEDANGKAIKTVLERAKDRYDRRRPSEEARIPDTAKELASGRSPRESPFLQSTRSPPPLTSRRRPARGEPSRNDLLWLNPTPERLREKAGMGDDQAVQHILEMKPMADAEAVLAAAKGGHEVCLSLLFALGKANPDPEPLRGFRDGLNTPMLVAIGRNNMRVLTLVLGQPGFDPTRRVFKKLTYYDLAKERKGVGWEEEYRILKSAFDKHKDRSGNKSPVAHKSPQSREGKKALREKAPTSPLRGNQKSSSPTLTAKDPLGRKKIVGEGKGVQLRKDRDKDGVERSSDSGKRLLKVPKSDSREGSSAISDREASPLVAVNGQKKRSLSDAEKDPPKPRKRLVSGKDLRNDHERKRRNSLISMGSASSAQEHVRANSNRDQTLARPKRDEKPEAKIDITIAKKRARRSDTPPDRRTMDSPKHSDPKKTKRARVNSDGNVQEKSNKAAPSGPARVANMGAAPPSSGSAPVAFMGSSSASAKISLPKQESVLSPPITGSEKSPSAHSPADVKTTTNQDSDSVAQQAQLADSSKVVKKEDEPEIPGVAASKTEAALGESKPNSREMDDSRDPQPSQASNMEPQGVEESPAQRDKEDDETIEKKRQQEAAQLKQQQEEELLRLKQQEAEAEAEAAALKRRQEEESAAAEEALRLKRQKELEEEEARRQKQAEEEAARLKRKQEEQEEIARLKKKREEEQERQRLRKLEEDERRRRDKLPEALRKSAELCTLGLGQTPQEAAYWLPLLTVKGCQRDPGCPQQVGDELWVSNIQVAPLLGLTDLDLSQCKFSAQYN